MTISLSYDPVLSRVQIALSGLPDGTVTVERSTNQLFWQTVRGGTALPIFAGTGSLDDYEFSPDVPNYYRVAGTTVGLVVGDDASPTGGDAALKTIIEAAGFTVDYLDDDDAVVVGYSTYWIADSVSAATVTTTYDTVVAPVITGKHDLWDDNRLSTNAGSSTAADADYITAAHEITDGFTSPVTILGSAQAQRGVLAAAIAAVAATVFARPAADATRAAGWAVEAGGALTAGTAPARRVAIFLPDAWPALLTADGQTLVGRIATWAAQMFDAAVITPSLNNQVWLKSVKYPMLNRPVKVLNWGPVGRPTRSGLHEVIGRSAPIAVHDIRASQRFTLTVLTHTSQELRELICAGGNPLEAVRDMDLILAADGTMFIHTPADSPVPGGYVEIGDTSQDRVARTAPNAATPYLFTLPCTVVAAPGPEVVGTTLTWATVFRLFDGWTQLIATNPTWAAALATVGSPDDLVVL